MSDSSSETREASSCGSPCDEVSPCEDTFTCDECPYAPRETFGYTGCTEYAGVTGLTGYTGVTGCSTGFSFTPLTSIAIGSNIPITRDNQCITINASNTTLTPSQGSLKIAPIRIVTTLTDSCLPLYYDADTCEIVAYDEGSSESSEEVTTRGAKRHRLQDEYAQDMDEVNESSEAKRSNSSCRLV